jgi:hypothetical protein
MWLGKPLRGAEPSFRPLMETKIEERSKEDPSMLRTKLTIIVILAIVLALPSVAWAQQGKNQATVNYFANVASNDNTVRITNTFTSNACANIYVIAPDQQLAECCACELTPGALLTLSVANDLTQKPLTNVTPNSGTIVVCGTVAIPLNTPALPAGPLDLGCDAGNNSLSLINALSTWVSHTQNNGAVTETPSDAIYSDICNSNLNLDTLGTFPGGLESECAAARILGSGQGVCTCGSGSGAIW